jgi:hypothetical protein
MTFKEFQATGVDCADLGAALQDESLKGQAGRVYLDSLFLEDTTGWPADNASKVSRWYTVIGRSEYTSDDIGQIERVLYDFAGSEGYFDTIKEPQ